MLDKKILINTISLLEEKDPLLEKIMVWIEERETPEVNGNLVTIDKNTTKHYIYIYISKIVRNAKKKEILIKCFDEEFRIDENNLKNFTQVIVKKT